MIIQCSACKTRYHYDEARFAGAPAKKIRCTKCAVVFEIRNPAVSSPPPTGFQPEETSSFGAPMPGSDDFNLDTTVMGAHRRKPAAAAPPGAAAAAPGAGTTAEVEKPAARHLGKMERQALSDLDLDDTADGPTIRARYTELVKRCHPDANGGDRSTEHKLQRVIAAYKSLKKAGLA